MTLNRLIRNVYYFLMSVLSLPLSGRVTPEQLYSYVQLFKSNWGALESHCGVIQLGLATAQTLHHPTLPRWDACLAFERLLLQGVEVLKSSPWRGPIRLWRGCLTPSES
uniref:Sec1 family domain containing 2 n=1 Tax=Hucho hucho TaxID=62062 RepID=A0A4W5PYB8_9TELE